MEEKLEYTFVMSEKKNGKFLYLHSDKQLYTYTADCKKGKTYRCYQRPCPSRVILKESDNYCIRSERQQPHDHVGNCEERFIKLKALESIKTKLMSVENLASGSRIAKPRAVYKAAVIE